MVKKGINSKLTTSNKVYGVIQAWVEDTGISKIIHIGWSTAKNVKSYNPVMCEQNAFKRAQEEYMFVPIALRNAMKAFVERCQMYYKDAILPRWAVQFCQS